MPNNLPQQLTSFVGREREISEIKHLLGSARLVSLVGVGGCGKTRLSLEVARSVLNRYPDGVWFVELAALSDPELVPQAVALALGIREATLQASFMPALLEHVQPRKMLLVLDNCEHLIQACASLTNTLLHASLTLRVLTTSREALGIGGEVAWRVPPLSLPDPERLPPIASLPRYEAVQLFIDRARQGGSGPGLSVTPENAQAIARLCHRLDGLPLAIELAAARTNILTIEQIVARLDERFRLLTSGSRAALPRQQTLGALLDWSYDLLSEQEQSLLRALSVFAGSFTLDAVVAVCSRDTAGADEYETLDLLSSLARKSLLVTDLHGSVGQYRLLETIRQYAWGKITGDGEARELRSKHREWYANLVEQAQPELLGEDQDVWLDRLEMEHDNLRAALEWSIRGEGNAEAALGMSAALWRFWDMRGLITEGRKWLTESLGMGGAAPLAVRARALNGAGNLALEQGDYDQAMDYYNAALALRRQIADKRGITNSLTNMGVLARRRGEYDRAAQLYEECMVVFEEISNKEGLASVLSNLGFVEQCRGNYARAEELDTKALALFQELGDKSGILVSLNNLGEAAQLRGDYARAGELYNQALGLARNLGDQIGIVDLLNNLGSLANHQNDRERATRLFLESLFKCDKLGHKQGIAECFEGLAATEARNRRERAAQLFGAAESLREEISTPLDPSARADYEQYVTAVRSGLSEPAFVAAWAKGRAMQPDEAIALATEGAPADMPAAIEPPGADLPAKLTRREAQILRRVASELSDAQIADELNISIRTVHAHLHSIYAKIGVSNRAGATRFAVEHKLL